MGFFMGISPITVLELSLRIIAYVAIIIIICKLNKALNIYIDKHNK